MCAPRHNEGKRQIERRRKKIKQRIDIYIQRMKESGRKEKKSERDAASWRSQVVEEHHLR